ncbi:MAG: ABC transporter ATP-binding protein [Candidatus Alkaliphilus sp. MAG34]|nr:ABC transporter ATP-binding protein [Clostridiales bacterium]
MKEETKIEVSELSYAYSGFKELFNNVSFTIKTGEVICILGPNGIGKTTLLNCIANLITPTKGRILVDGKDMNKMSPQDIARTIGYVPQTIMPSFDYEVLEYVVTGCAPRLGTFERPKDEHYSIARDAMSQMKISHLSHKAYTKISGGERQQVSIARAISQRPKIILMDEPTAHLDCGNQIKVLKIIKEMARKGYGVVFTTHNPDQALLLKTKIAAFDRNGNFSFGTYREVLDEGFLRSMYGIDLHLYNIDEIGRSVCIAPAL